MVISDITHTLLVFLFYYNLGKPLHKEELLLIQGGLFKKTKTGTEPRVFLPPENQN